MQTSKIVFFPNFTRMAICAARPFSRAETGLWRFTVMCDTSKNKPLVKEKKRSICGKQYIDIYVTIIIIHGFLFCNCFNYYACAFSFWFSIDVNVILHLTSKFLNLNFHCLWFKRQHYSIQSINPWFMLQAQQSLKHSNAANWAKDGSAVVYLDSLHSKYICVQCLWSCVLKSGDSHCICLYGTLGDFSWLF